MKIVRLDLTAFGTFTDVTLDLGAGREGLHVIFGPNEAGKSTALRALRQLFYGIPETSTDNFLHAHAKLRIGAALKHSDGSTLECVRRKGRKNTLLDPDGAAIDDAALAQFLGGVDQLLFETMFGIDHEGLVQGGLALLQGGGEVGQILFAAGAGLGDLRAVQQRLEEEMQALFLASGKNPRINQTLLELEKAHKEIRALELPSADWQQQDQELRQAEERRREVQRQLDDRQRERGRLERLGEALPLLAERATRLAERVPLADAVLLPEDFGEQRREVTTALVQARAAERDAEAELAKVAAAIAELSQDVPQALLDQTERIEELYRRLGSHQKATADRAKLNVDLTRLEVTAREILRDLRPDLDLACAEELRLSAADRARIHTLGSQQQGLIKACELAEERVADLRRKLDDATARLAGLEKPRDAEELRHTLRRLQQAGPLEEQHEACRAELRRVEQQAAVDLQALPLWSGPLAELEKLPLPSAETIERFDAELGTLDQQRNNLRQRLDELHTERLGLEAQLDQLRLEQDVPTEADLESVRRRRDEIWRTCRTGMLAPDQADEYERQVRRADDLADRLRREASRVATHAQLQAGHKKCSERLDLTRRQADEVNERHTRQQREWEALWRPLGIAPRTPREMRAWSRQWTALVDQARTIRLLRDQLESLGQRVQAQCHDLLDCLQKLNESVGREEGLVALVARGETLIEHLERTARVRRQLEQAVEELANELPQAEAQAGKAGAQLAGWQEQWREAMKLLGLGQAERATVAEANAVLAGVGDVLAKLGEAASHRERIAGIDRDAETFRQDVAALSVQVAPDLIDVPVEQAAEALHARLIRGRSAQTQLAGLTEQRTRETAKWQSARTLIAEMEGRLAGLCRDAGCVEPGDLSQAEERSNQLRKLDEEIRRLEQHLLQRSAGLSLADFLVELKEVDPDALPPQLQRLTQEVDELKQESEKLGETIGGARALLQKMDGGASAADSAEQIQGLLARVGFDAEQFARLRLATRVLQRAIERYRDKNQAPVLQRASELFARLTLGSFAGLRLDHNDAGENVLVGVRPGGKEAVGVHGMSAGSRDQLYLALRLASLEAFLARHEPLPLILDDILIHFDNERAAAVLRALAEFSQRTQIIFFTHHAHLVELAEHHLDGEVLFTHRLETESRIQNSETGTRTLEAGLAKKDGKEESRKSRSRNKPAR